MPESCDGGVLAGVKIVELAGIGPGPYCGQLLADLGADVVQVRRRGAEALPVENRGKRSIDVDLRKPGAAEVVLKLVERADALIEGYRPGVAERLGIGPEACFKRNPALVYGRMTGWGQQGPMSRLAGHDINYIGLTGALHAMGRAEEPPIVPLNLVGDYGGGSLFLALGIVAALLKARATGQGDIVDAAIVDGAASMMGVIHSLHATGRWSTRRNAHLLDGSRPYYRCYRTSDGKFMAVGCLEPEFFAVMLDKLGVTAADFGEQNDSAAWPSQHRMLEQIFASKARDEWARIFEGTDACVTPVLDYVEAQAHPHNLARRSHELVAGVVHPVAAPRFASRASWQPIPYKSDTEILRESGFGNEDIARLIADGTVQADASARAC